MVKKLFFVAVSLLTFADIAGAGTYQRALFTGALVWNDGPQANEEVTWSGQRDAQGYATGNGTLTRFARGKMTVTGSSILRENRSAIVAKTTGYMEHGKFVSAPKNPSPNANPKSEGRKQRRTTPASVAAEDQGAAKTPSPPKGTAERPSPSRSATPAPSVNPGNDSLNSLARPPSSLGLSATPEASPHPSPEQSASPSP